MHIIIIIKETAERLTYLRQNPVVHGVRNHFGFLPRQVPCGGVHHGVAFCVGRGRQSRVLPDMPSHQAVLVPLPAKKRGHL